MNLVVEIYSYTNSKARVKLENGFTFALYKGEIRKYKIRESEYISEDMLQEIIEEILMKRAKERALFLLKDSARTKKQICDKLRLGYYPDIVIERVVKLLEKYSYIDDYEYALNYIENNCKRKSIMRMKNDLYSKGIDKSLLDEALKASEIDEEMSISKVIENKSKRYNLNDAKDKQKFYGLLLRRGYSYDTITKGLRNVGVE